MRPSGRPRGNLQPALVLLVAMVLGLAPGSRSAQAQAQQNQPKPDRPNIVFILADDLGYGDLGCYGQQQIQTPHLDRMAAEGMRFTHFYAGSTVCAPSRAVLMTGLHSGHAYIRGNARHDLRPEDVTVAEVLKQAGYATGLVGKWGLGQEGGTGVPNRQGFDYFFGYLDQAHAHNYYPTFLLRNEARLPLANVVPDEGPAGQGVAAKKVEYSPDLMTREALDFVDRNKDRPFFLYLAYTLPHANNEAGDAGMEVPDHGPYEDRDWPQPQKGLAAMITRLDRDIGSLLARLKEHGLDERTLVLFSSDNGPHREGGNRPDFFNSSGPLRGFKRDLYEGGIRVPLIARWPGRVPAGSESDHVGHFADFLPTAAQVAGAEVPSRLDGVSFLPALLGQAERQPRHDYLYWEFYEQGSSQAVRMGHWKAVAKPMGGPIELYDLRNDLSESHDVAQEHPEAVGRMRAAMREAHVPSPLWKASKSPPPPNVLLIVSDDQRWTDFGFMGHDVIKTPHLDRLAAESAVFANGYVPTSLCRASLATLLTGLYAHQHKICCNDPPDGMDRAAMHPFIENAPAVPRLLRGARYFSLQTGKFWEGHYSNAGFTHGMTTKGRHGDDGLVIGRQTMQPIYDFVERQGSPFFIWYAPMMPHEPHNPPQRLLSKYAAPDRPEKLAKYFAMCEWFDETCGQLLDYLDRQGLSDNTLVIFVVDNGWIQETGEQRTTRGWFAPKSKLSPYDGGLRTPVMLRWPGHTKAGRYDDLVSTIDLAPTILAACNVAAEPAGMPGLDLLGVAAGRGRLDRDAVFGEIYEHTSADIERPALSLTHRWVRQGDWKLIVPAAGPAELYNLRDDPFEETDLAADHAGRVESLAALVDQHWRP
ncbi:MAG: sulfatase-like hydrolase/transferase [Pirellulales bacterium]